MQFFLMLQIQVNILLLPHNLHYNVCDYTKPTPWLKKILSQKSISSASYKKITFVLEMYHFQFNKNHNFETCQIYVIFQHSNSLFRLQRTYKPFLIMRIPCMFSFGREKMVRYIFKRTYLLPTCLNWLQTQIVGPQPRR